MTQQKPKIEISAGKNAGAVELDLHGIHIEVAANGTVTMETAPAPVETPPAPAAPKVPSPSRPFGFLLPAPSLAGSFNAASGFVEGQALPNCFEQNSFDTLADFRDVLFALAEPGLATHNRKAIFPVALGDVTPGGEEPVKMIMGDSWIGFDMAFLQARDDAGKPVYLFALRDKVCDRMLVAGPGEIAPPLEAALSRKGLRYVVRSNEDAPMKIDEFLADGARRRGETGYLKAGETQNVIGDMLKAFALLHGEPEPAENKSMTVGRAVHDTQTPRPALYTIIRKPS